MPLRIVRNDITRMKSDAIVNPSNPALIPGGGTDAAIHAAAGPLLMEACRRLSPCPVGEARISPAYELPCKYVIHTAGPLWEGGSKGEAELLTSCYKNAMKLALEHKCRSVAFPLISSGLFAFPKDLVLKLALNALSSFLFEGDTEIFLVVYDRESYELSGKLFGDIREYIDENYVNLHRSVHETTSLLRSPRGMPEKPCAVAMAPLPPADSKAAIPDIEEYIKLDKPFAYKLWDLIKAKGMDSTRCYKKANVSKQTWYKIETDPHYKPSKKTVISFAIALELSLEETQELLGSVGFTLSQSSLFDVIIMYCMEKGIYDVLQVDSVLFHYDQETLFSKY